MSNVDNEGLRTLDEVRARRAQRGDPVGVDPVADQIVRNAVSAYEDSTPVRAELPGGLFSRLNPGELEEIEARLKAATDGPWTIYAGHTGIRNTLPYAWVGPEVEQWDGGRKIAPVVERANGGTMADMRFIAHARVDVEKLINTINALSRRVAKRFNETAQARQDAAAARERAESADRRLAEFRELLRSETLLVEAERERADRAERALEARGPMADLGHLADAVAGRERLEREVNRLTAELYQARTKVEEYGRDAMERTKVVDKIRQRFGIEPGEDLYEGLSRKVGDLQTSEAELVSAPLKARITELERSVKARDRLLDTATRDLAKSNQANTYRETEIQLLETALEDWRQAGEKIAKAVYDQETVDALEEVHSGSGPLATLRDVVRKIQAALPRMKPSGS